MPDDPLNIVSIDQINNKSIVVTIGDAFTGIENFEVYKISDPSQKVSVVPVDDSVNPALNKKDIVGKAAAKFETGVGYTLKITRSGETALKDFTVGAYPPPNNAYLQTFGDRILNVIFDQPIQNLDAVNVNKELENFYLLFFGMDTNASEVANPLWLGKITVDPSFSDQRVRAFARVASDLKSMEIQFNTFSLPIGQHDVIINYSKDRVDFTSALKDFSDEQRVAPIRNLAFTIAKDDVAAKAIKAEAPSRTEVIITFDKPVLQLPDETQVILVDGLPVMVSSVVRVGNTFNSLKYIINELTALPVGKADITIEGITDACGYKTEEALFADVPVVSVPPRIVNLIQVTPADLTTTQLVAYWSKAMKNTPGIGDVTDPSNYALRAEDGTIVPIIGTPVYNMTDRTLTITTQKADAGKYKFYAEKAQDTLGETMDPQVIEIYIEDKTIPAVSEIDYRLTSIVIKFDDAMNVIGDHSAIERLNYMIQDRTLTSPNDRVILPADTQTLAMNNNMWIRLKLPETFKPAPRISADYLIHIGYPELKEIRYVEDASHNIYPLCDLQNIDRLYEELNITNGLVAVLASDRLEYRYNLLNEFYSVNPADFTVTVEGVVTNPLSVVKVDGKTIDFYFPTGTFSGGTTSVIVATKATTLSQDIFGYIITPSVQTSGAVINGMKAELIAASLINTTDTNATIRLSFNKEITHFELNDFRVVLNNQSILSFEAYTPPVTPGRNFDIPVTMPRLFSLDDEFEVSLAVPPAFIRTIDKDGNKIADFGSKIVSEFLADLVAWRRVAPITSVAGNIIEVEYNYPIDTKTIITNSLFDTTSSPWDGTTPLTIPAGALIFRKGTGSDNVTLRNNPNFGGVQVFSKSTAEFITGTVDTNYITVADAKLTLINGNKVQITVSPTETLSNINPSAINYVQYVGTTNIQDSKDAIFLYDDYQPTASPSDV